MTSDVCPFKTGTYKTTMLTRPCVNDHKIVFRIKSQIVVIKLKKSLQSKLLSTLLHYLPFCKQTSLETMKSACVLHVQFPSDLSNV